jgi:hypothetical protein
MGKRVVGGYTQIADLCDAERDVTEAMTAMQALVNAVALPVQALTVMLKVVFLLVRATTAIHRAREISRNTRTERDEE